jgi:DNA-binding MarR family transcriptional regulator
LSVPTTDPTEQNRWRPLWLLLRRLDEQIVQVYVDAGIADFRSRFTMPLVRLSRLGPMSIKALAAECEVTHSAMSQTVTAMRRAGLVESVPDPDDGRARLVELTDAAQQIVSLGEAEWAATEAVLAELEAETPYPMSQVVRDLETALERRSFAERLHDHLGRA